MIDVTGKLLQRASCRCVANDEAITQLFSYPIVTLSLLKSHWNCRCGEKTTVDLVGFRKSRYKRALRRRRWWTLRVVPAPHRLCRVSDRSATAPAAFSNAARSRGRGRTCGSTSRAAKRPRLPARAAPLLGAVVGDVARFMIGGTVIVVLGLILGFRPEAGIGGVLAGMAVALVFAFALAWVFYVIGLVMRSPQAVNSAGFVAIFPLMFLSNVFVDPETMPAGVRAVAEVNPMTHLVTAVRGLMEGTATAGDVGLVLATSALLTAIFAPLTVRLYYRKGS
jgi:hypothetical protein